MRISRARLRKILRYEPKSGKFIRIKKTGKKGRLGQPVGSLKPHGYVSIQILGIRYYAHHLAWLYMTGEWPREIDHKNGIRSDNRWTNLRQATRFFNNGNRKKHRGPLPKGVIKVVNRGGSVSYFGRITVRGKQIYLGARATPQEAHDSYVAAAKKYYGQFARAA